MDYRRFHLPDPKQLARRDYLLAAASGLLLALAFPKPGLSLLAWFALVPLLMAAGRRTPRQCFSLGLVTGLVGNAGLFYWINIVMVQYGKLPWAISFFLYLLLVAYLALYPAVAIYLARRAEEQGWPLAATLPLLWVSLELLRGWLLSGFPWALLGHSQYRTLPLIQIADITGVYGVSALVVLGNLVLYRLLRGAVQDRLVFPGRSAGVFLCCLVLTLGYGIVRLTGTSDGPTMKVGLVQGNIDQSVKWSPAWMTATVEIYERLSREVAKNGIDLLVWPESAAPFYFQQEEQMAARLRRLAGELKVPFLFGSPAAERRSDSRLHYLNSAFLLAPNGVELGRSDKLHLVPFGEYVPLQRLLPFVHKMVEGIGDFSPGEKVTPLNTGKGEIGVLVCFEGIFPELARAYVKAGSRLLVNITNDAWFGRSSAPYQHQSVAVFRAVENRVPVVRAANTGITSLIDDRGHILRMTGLFQEATLAGEVRLGTTTTLYTRYGDLFAWGCVAGSLLMLIFPPRRDAIFSQRRSH